MMVAALLVAAAVSPGLAARAAEPPAEGTEQAITWQEAVELALAANPDLASAQRSRAAQRAAYLGSLNGLMPQLSLTNGYSAGADQSRDSRWQAGASASLALFDWGRVASVRSASAGLDRASAALRKAAADARSSLRRAFVGLYNTQDSIETSRRIAEMRRKGSELVSLRYESGRESKGNMLRARAQAFQAEADLAQAGRDLRTARRTLSRHLGGEEFRALVATGAIVHAEPPALPADEEPLLRSRPDVEAQEAALRFAAADAQSARSTFLPNLYGRYSRSVTGPDEPPSARWGWTGGLTLSLPLFGGGPTAAWHGLAAAARRLEAARQTLRAVRADALVDIESAWSGFANASAQLQVQQALLEAARQRSDEADVRYASGLLSYDNWEIITTDRVNQERRALQAGLDAANAEAAWDRALGRGLGERP